MDTSGFLLETERTNVNQMRQGVTIDPLEGPTVVGRDMRLPIGRPGRLVVSSIYDQLLNHPARIATSGV